MVAEGPLHQRLTLIALLNPGCVLGYRYVSLDGLTHLETVPNCGNIESASLCPLSLYSLSLGPVSTISLLAYCPVPTPILLAIEIRLPLEASGTTLWAVTRFRLVDSSPYARQNFPGYSVPPPGGEGVFRQRGGRYEEFTMILLFYLAQHILTQIWFLKDFWATAGTTQNWYRPKGNTNCLRPG